MKAKLYGFNGNEFKKHQSTIDDNDFIASLVLVFGNKEIIKGAEFNKTVRSKFPHAEITYCSTAGEICQMDVKDGCAVVTALSFEKTKIKTAKVNSQNFTNSKKTGAELAKKIDPTGLNYLMILSDGATVNGSELILGIEEVLGKDVLITGGLAGDGTNFQSTLVGLNEEPQSGNVVAIGFYGDSLIVEHGSKGGWDVFGPEKTITRSKGNVLYEIDGKNALSLYKEYLGTYADELPGSALLFPLSMSVDYSDETLVRTILNIDNSENSMTFAGDVPEGARVRFMKANFDNIIGAASEAAHETNQENKTPDYALLISCVGRKIILKNRTEEEVEAVAEMYGGNTVISGFYSYGELSPFNGEQKCQLHNQTMTITTFTER
jgi:hypothetical protein